MAYEKYNTSATLENKVKDLERRVRTMETAPRLPNSSIGTGGLIVEDGGNLTVRDGGNVLIEDGGDILINNGGQIIAVEENGATVKIANGVLSFRYNTSENYGEILAGLDLSGARTALWMTPPWSAVSEGTNQLIIEGSSADSLGNAWLDTDGELTLESGSHTFMRSSDTWVLTATNTVFIDSTTANVQITALSAAFLTAGGTITIDSGNNNTLITHTTTASAANCFISSAGRIMRNSSALKYKDDVQDFVMTAEPVYQMNPRSWQDKVEVSENPGSTRRFIGFIAEELLALGLTEFVTYDDETGELDGIAYPTLTVALVVAVKDLNERLTALEGQND